MNKLCVALTTVLLTAIFLTSTLAASDIHRFGPFTTTDAEPTIIRLSGPITEGDGLNFRRAVQHAPQATLVALDSPGGSVYAGLLIALEIYERKLSTTVPANAKCLSACSMIFFAGLERQANGKLGVHQISGGEASGTQLAVADIIEMLTLFEVSNDVLSTMFRTPAHTMYVFTEEEIDRFSINRTIQIPEGNYGDYSLASCAGWNGTVTELSDQDQTSARMSGLVTEFDLVEYCERDPGWVTIKNGGTKTVSECVKDHRAEINTSLRTIANCDAGILRFFYGTHPERMMRLPLPEDTSCQSGLPPLIDQFNKLCPATSQRLQVQR